MSCVTCISAGTLLVGCPAAGVALLQAVYKSLQWAHTDWGGCAGMDFRYTDPDRGFKRASVKGVLGRLVELKDSQHATALEVAAGGKLYQVSAPVSCHKHAWLALSQGV